MACCSPCDIDEDVDEDTDCWSNGGEEFEDEPFEDTGDDVTDDDVDEFVLLWFILDDGGISNGFFKMKCKLKTRYLEKKNKEFIYFKF